MKRSVAETDPVQCEHERELAGITSFENGAKWSCSGAEIVLKVAFLVCTEPLCGTVSATLHFTPGGGALECNLTGRCPSV